MASNEAAAQAMRDIIADYKGVKQTWYTDEQGTRTAETWFVCGVWLYNIESRKLNRRLGISHLNNGGARIRNHVKENNHRTNSKAG